MKQTFVAIGVAFLVLLLLFMAFFSLTPMGRTLWNNWFFAVQKADDATMYATRKQVEDTARAMISSYNTDKLTYEQYRTADTSEKRGWAEQAKMRANKTASTYNNYILENSFVWRENIPLEIHRQLEYLK